MEILPFLSHRERRYCSVCGTVAFHIESFANAERPDETGKLGGGNSEGIVPVRTHNQMHTRHSGVSGRRLRVAPERESDRFHRQQSW